LAKLTAEPSQSHRIHVLSRKPSSANANATVVSHTGDLANEADLDGFLCGPGTLVNLAYSADASPDEAESNARLLVKYAVKTGIRRLIHCSTAVVVGKCASDRISENTRPEPVSDYEQVKLAIENIFFSEAPAEMEIFVVRPTAVFGPGGKNVIKLVRDRVFNSAFKNFLLDSVYGRRSMNFVSVEKVVASLVHFMELDSSPHAKPVREIMICSADESPENNYAFLAREVHRRFRTKEFPLPRLPFISAALPLLLRLAERSGSNPKRKYISSSAERLGFRYDKPFADELREYLDWLRNSGEVERR